MMAANYRHIGGGENRLGRHYSRFSGIWPTAFLADQSLALRKSQNGGSNRRRRASLAPWVIEQRRTLALAATNRPVYVRGNADAIEDAIRNLVENAVATRHWARR